MKVRHLGELGPASARVAEKTDPNQQQLPEDGSNEGQGAQQI